MRKNKRKKRKKKTATNNSLTCSSVAHPITFSTPALLYHDLSKITISPADGRCLRYRCQYHWVFSVSVGLASATTRRPRWLSGAVSLLMTPPLPAASRPSKMTRTRRPLCLIQSWYKRRLVDGVGVGVVMRVEKGKEGKRVGKRADEEDDAERTKKAPALPQLFNYHLPADELDLELFQLLVCVFCDLVKNEREREKRLREI